MRFLLPFYQALHCVAQKRGRQFRLASLALLIALSLSSLLVALNPAGATAGGPPPTPTRKALARLSNDVSIRAAGRGAPFVTLSDGHKFITAYEGALELVTAL